MIAPISKQIGVTIATVSAIDMAVDELFEDAWSLAEKGTGGGAAIDPSECSER